MLLLAVEYLAFTFVACLGILQWVALRQRLQGLYFLSSRPWGYALSLVLIVAPFAAFFLGRDRIRPGLEGLQQFLLFSLSALLAVAFTLTVSSLFKTKRAKGHPDPLPLEERQGLESLRDKTYFQAWKQGREV